MTTVLSNGMRVNLRFQYGTDKRGRRTTSAIVYAPGFERVNGALITKAGMVAVLYKATTACSMDDQFTKDSGRHVAMEKLLKKYSGKLTPQETIDLKWCYESRARRAVRSLPPLPMRPLRELEIDFSAKQAQSQQSSL